MAADTAALMRPSGYLRATTAFRHWRRSRPFWGGLLMILCGVELFLSGNLDLGNLQIHLGVTGFLSYIVPAFMILCGALAWATPAQRMFYGILGTLAAIYSIISVNLGGFILGFVLGIIGGGLTVAWVPVKYWPVAIPAPRDGDPDGYPDGNEQFIDFTGRHAMAEAGEDEGEGKQGTRFPFPQPAASDDHELTQGPDSRLRTPRFVITGAVALMLAGSIGFVTLRNPQAAAAAGCALPPITQLRTSAQAKHTPKPATPKPTTQKATTPKPTTGQPTTRKPTTQPKETQQPAMHGDGRLAGGQVTPNPDPGPIGGLLGGILGLLGGPTGAPTTPAPSDPATTDPSTAPIETPAPTPTSAPDPTGSPTTTGAPTGGKPTVRPTVAPSPSCELVVKKLAAAASQATVQDKPATMKADTLTMTGLSYDGNIDLPTKNGTITVMQFSMDSSTSTPFELDVTVNGLTTKTKSSSLTVAGNVKLYATEIKGNALGVLPVDYTPTNPPPIVPPILFFTSVTIGLEDVACDTLTADSLTIN